MEPISTSWYDIGITLNISIKDREVIKSDLSLSVNAKLEKLLDRWISKQTPDVTWETILKVLAEREENAIAKDITKYLEKRDVYDKYINKDDFVNSSGTYIIILYLYSK